MTSDEPWKDPDVLRRLYHDEEMSTREIADELGVSSSTVSNWLNRTSVKTRPNTQKRSPKARGEAYDKSTLHELYVRRKLTLRETAEKVNCDPQTVKEWLDRYDIGTRKGPASHKPAPFRTHLKGYEQWRCHGNRSEHIVYVHRLLAVSEYGADAVDGMHVHHKNKIPWDNRPENIELMTPEEHSRHHYSLGEAEEVPAE